MQLRTLLRTLVFQSSLWALALAAPYSLAQGPLGDQFTVNGEEAVTFAPSVGAAADGRFVVVWSANSTSDEFETIQGQLYGSDGAPVGGQFRVNTVTEGRQEWAHVAMAPNGDFVAVWPTRTGSQQGIQAQRYSSTGQAIGSFLDLSPGTQQPEVAAFGEGFVAVYGENSELIMRRFHDATGVLGAPEVVNTLGGVGTIFPKVAVAPDGASVVTWSSTISAGADGDQESVQARRFDAAGLPIGDQFQVNTTTTGRQWFPDVGVAGDGDFVITWQENGAVTRPMAQRFASDGTARGGEFEVSPEGSLPRTASASDGTFSIVWTAALPFGLGAEGRTFDASGVPITDVFSVPSSPESYDTTPDLAFDGEGQFVVVWESNRYGEFYRIAGRQFRASLFADGFESGDLSRWSAVQTPGAP